MDRVDDTVDEFKAGLFMMKKIGSVADKSNDGGDKFVDVADMSEKTGSEMMCSMIMTSGTVLMETCGDDNKPNDIEEEFVQWDWFT